MTEELTGKRIFDKQSETSLAPHIDGSPVRQWAFNVDGSGLLLLHEGAKPIKFGPTKTFVVEWH